MPSWSSELWVQPLRELGLHEWLWLVEKAVNGMREASKAFQTQVRRTFTEDGWVVVKNVSCQAYHVKLDALCGFHGDDFCREGEHSALDEFDQSIVECFKAKIMPHVGPGGAGEGTVLRRLLVWNDTGFLLQPDQKHFQNLAELLEVGGVKLASTPTSMGTGRTSRDALERQSGSNPKQKVRWDLHVPRTRRVRRAVHSELPRVRYAGADGWAWQGCDDWFDTSAARFTSACCT